MSDNHPDHDQLQDYAFACLDSGEAERVRAHLVVCEICRRQVNELERVLGELALALPPVEPPPDLEQKLMLRIKDSAAAAAQLRGVPRKGGISAAPDRTTPIRGRSTPRSTAEGRHFSGRVLGALAAGVILVLGAGNVIQWQHAASAHRGASATGLSLIVLAGVDASADTYGTVVLDPQDNGGVLAVRGLPRLDASHTYQLWLYRESEQRSGGIFGVSADGYGNLLLDVPKDFKGFTSIGITVEPAGGSLTPSGLLVAKGSP
jgi:anti-sigma-K factor RskA